MLILAKLQTYEMTLFGRFLGPYSNTAEILTIGSTLANKNIVWKKKLKDSSFSEKETDPKFALLVQLWPHSSP